MIDSPTTSLYKKQGNVFDKLMIGLQNYWPIINENVNDTVGMANMYGGVNVSFTNDRFNNSNSAIDLNDGYYSIPAGQYVCGDFTFSIWAYFREQTTRWNRFMDLDNADGQDSIIFAYSMDNNDRIIGFHIFKGFDYLSTISPGPFTINTWDHYAFTLSGTTGSLYINGNRVACSTQHLPVCRNRTSNFIGKSNSNADLNANAIYDEIRLYNRALDVNEIQSLMKL